MENAYFDQNVMFTILGVSLLVLLVGFTLRARFTGLGLMSAGVVGLFSTVVYKSYITFN